MVTKYARKADPKRRAKTAVEKWENTEVANTKGG
jgi:hypothetical protein